MASVALGASGMESETHLPTNVTTLNTIDAVALLTLCQSEQNLISAPDRSKIREPEKNSPAAQAADAPQISMASR
jgi:hypothetical protein